MCILKKKILMTCPQESGVPEREIAVVHEYTLAPPSAASATDETHANSRLPRTPAACRLSTAKAVARFKKTQTKSRREESDAKSMPVK